MLRAVVPPLITAYAVFVAMVLLARRRPVPRDRLPEQDPRRRRTPIATVVGGYTMFLAIVLVFHVWLAGERDAFVEAVWGGAFLASVAVATALVSAATSRR